MPRAISPVFQAGLIGYKRYLAWAAGFSFVVNLLTLAIPLYTIQVYDRVLSSGSGATLMVLTVAVIGGMATLGHAGGHQGATARGARGQF